MSTNKHAQIRYQALDNCFRNPGRRYFIGDLIKACNDALYNQVGLLNGVKERQVRDDIDTTNAVGFEHNPYLKGLSLFSDIFNAIVNKQPFRINYKRFDKESREHIFHPYFLKQYNHRWFLFGLCEHLKEKKAITNLALDRVPFIEA